MESLGAVLLLFALLTLDSLILARLAIWLDPRGEEHVWRQERAEKPALRRAA